MGRKGLGHKMERGTFWDIFEFSIGKKISETIFLVDFSRSKWQKQIFPKTFFFFSKIFL
jgi:hypothetical protein